MALSARDFWAFSLRVHGRAGSSELSPQMDPQLRGAAKPRLYALFLPSGLLTCMQRVGRQQGGSKSELCALAKCGGHRGDVNIAGLQE
ncbi:hypothetical protein DHEL01_v204086 [Diaporthe helianthi]|uniref:Uncharacterized protein n=1 Tax=Diaporthe helianthi TaxID=158607 RepID=A0A2P5I4U0_DIAHE|nr:hypothetical protein DHEL01_v204086 [Diaporthe helianthi]